MALKKGLGRGLDALLPSSPSPAAKRGDGSIPPEGELRELPVDVLQRGQYQPRSDMHNESLQDLADSIKAQGVVQPIAVRPIGGGKYEIIAGERRWRASQLAGLQTIPAVIRDVPDSAAIAMALIENIQRENLNPMEEALALQRLVDEFDLTHQQAAEAVGRSRAAVSNLLRLLDLEPQVKELVEKRYLEMGHARALLALQGQEQIQAGTHIATKGMSVRETEKYVKHVLNGPAEKTETHKPDPNIIKLETDISEKLGAKVAIQHGEKGSGKIVVSYNNLDELDGILAHIK